MRTIRKIIIHCSDTPPQWCDQYPNADAVHAEIRRWHVDERGWDDIGYHRVYHVDGQVTYGRPLEVVGAHVRGRNSDSIGLCYVGGRGSDGRPHDTRTTAQYLRLKADVAELLKQFPGATVHGHNEFDNKACPSFNVQLEEWEATEAPVHPAGAEPEVISPPRLPAQFELLPMLGLEHVRSIRDVTERDLDAIHLGRKTSRTETVLNVIESIEGRHGHLLPPIGGLVPGDIVVREVTRLLRWAIRR